MANNYTQIHIQAVFAVQNRQSLISGHWKDELYKYMTGIVQNQGHKLLAINGMPDYIHLLFGFRPTQSLSDLMKHMKQDSSAWVNKKGFQDHKFSWQVGYGASSYSKSQLPKVIKYIQEQEKHHQRKTFTEEDLDSLKAFEIEFDEQYIFKPIR